MIDTVSLHTGAFDLRRDHKFQSVTVADEHGEVVRSKRFANLERPSFNCKVESRGGAEVLYVESVSVPKLIHGSNLIEVQETDVEQAVEMIENKLNEVGVEINRNGLNDFSISRVDLCANLPVDYHPAEYVSVLNKCKMARMQKTSYGNETISFRNGERTLNLYNKVREVLEQERDLQARRIAQSIGETQLRVEAQLKRGRVVNRLFLGGARFHNLFSRSVARSYLSDQLGRELKQTDETQMSLSFKSNSELLSRLRASGKRYSFSEFLRIRGAENFLSDFDNDFSEIDRFLEMAGFKRQTRWRAINGLKQTQRLIMPKHQKDLINELLHKLAA